MSFGKEFAKGLWKDIAPFRLVLGLCPTLAMTTSAENGLGMGLATAFVLVCSNVIISLIRSFIPKEVRIAGYIIVIATFTTVVDLLMKAYFFSLSQSLGLFIPLIVVNCILLGRAEAFASKRGVVDSLADGLGIGLGYTISLFSLGTLREIFGAGTFLGASVFGPGFEPMGFLQQAPGAFVCLGLMLAVMTILGNRRKAEE